MKISQRGLDLIQSFEGVRLKAYQCSAGVWTIGVGHTNGVKSGDVIDSDTADRFFRADVRNVELQLEAVLKVPVTSGQWDALVSFVFNLGIGAFKKSTMLRLLNAGDAHGASDEFLKWNKAGGKALEGLTRRRSAERTLFMSA